MEVTFNPEAPSTPTPEPIGDVPSGIACPSTHQCTVVSKNGTEASFDPADPARGTSYPINSQVPVAIACPTTNQCSALDGGHTAVTFDPTSRGSSRHDTINDPQDSLVAIACPSVSEGVTIGTDGDAFVGTFAAARLKAPSTARLATRITVTASGLNPGRYSLALYVVAIASAHPTVCTGQIGPTTKASSGQLTISGFLPTRLPCHSGAGPIVGYLTVRPGTYELILGGAAGAQPGTSGITRTIHLTR
jgi:hypothetical protein